MLFGQRSCRFWYGTVKDKTIRAKLFENTDSRLLDKKYQSFTECLTNAINWNASKEPKKYWRGLYDRLQNDEQL